MHIRQIRPVKCLHVLILFLPFLGAPGHVNKNCFTVWGKSHESWDAWFRKWSKHVPQPLLTSPPWKFGEIEDNVWPIFCWIMTIIKTLNGPIFWAILGDITRYKAISGDIGRYWGDIGDIMWREVIVTWRDVTWRDHDRYNIARNDRYQPLPLHRDIYRTDLVEAQTSKLTYELRSGKRPDAMAFYVLLATR